MDNNNAVSVSDLLDRVTEGLDLSDANKQSFLSLYTAASLKNTLEILISFRGNDPLFMKELNSFFESEFAKLNETTKMQSKSLLASESIKLFYFILETYSENLPDDAKQIISENVAKLSSENQG